jgi:Zn-dependent protease
MARKVKRGEYTIVEPSYSTSYTLDQGYSPRPRHPLTSPIEIRDILAALGALTVAFYLIINGGFGFGKDAGYLLGLAALSVFAGFLVHELSHKFVARRYGCWAEFRADYRMLGFAIITAFFGFLLAAPGAVMIAGNVDRERNGKISIAGPGSNLVIAVACLSVLLLTGVSGLAGDALSRLFMFSVILGGFNMIPIMPFDGAKIWRWNKPIYIMTLLAAGFLFFLAFTP